MQYYYRFVSLIIVTVLVVGCGSTGITENAEKDTENTEITNTVTRLDNDNTGITEDFEVQNNNATVISNTITKTVADNIPVINTITNKNTNSANNTNATPVQVKQITVTLQVSGAGVQFKHAIKMEEDATVDAVMRKAKIKYKLGYATSEFGGIGVFVDGIGGVQSDKTAGMYWILSVNGKKSTVGVSSKVVHEGDVISWAYEKAF